MSLQCVYSIVQYIVELSDTAILLSWSILHLIVTIWTIHDTWYTMYKWYNKSFLRLKATHNDYLTISNNWLYAKFCSRWLTIFYKIYNRPSISVYTLAGNRQKHTLAKITVLISYDHDIDIYLISRYISKTVVLLSPNTLWVFIYYLHSQS